MAEYLDKSTAVDEGHLIDWYINSVAEYDDEKLNEPRWTEAHIEELTNDFIVIPKDTPAADIVPVIKCKECKYFGDAKINKKGYLICPASGMEIGADDFCSYAERKGE